MYGGVLKNFRRVAFHPTRHRHCTLVSNLIPHETKLPVVHFTRCSQAKSALDLSCASHHLRFTTHSMALEMHTIHLLPLL